MLQTNSIHIDPEVLTMRFACDLCACHGVCCTAPGGSGPPITEDEVPLLHEVWPVVKHLVPAEHVAIVERDGIVDGAGRGLHVNCLNQRACVFVCYEGGIALCAIEKAFRQGLVSWPKPLSCHLFPIRLRRKAVIHCEIEEFDECCHARERGEAENIRLVDFLREPLIRAFGEARVSALFRCSPEEAP